MIESANKAINTVIESVEPNDVLKLDAAILLSELQILLSTSAGIDGADIEINQEGLNKLSGITSMVGR